MTQATRDAGVRLERLLGVLTWLAQHGQVSLSELSQTFGMTPEQLVADLELAACCGLPPYTPDRLMEIIVGEETVEARLGDDLARPRRLSAQEGFALAAAVRAAAAARGVAPDDPLARALAKLDAALGDRGVIGIDLGEPAHLATVRDGLARGRQLEIDYLSAWRDARSTRVVDPVALSASEGHWYLDAWCHEAGGTRRFRVDRISSVEETGEAVVPKAPPADDDHANGRSLEPFVPGPEATLVRIAVSTDGAWLLDAVPVIETSAMPDGRTEVTLGVVSAVWLERLLLQLGPAAEVLEPEDMKDLGREAAAKVLALYEG